MKKAIIKMPLRTRAELIYTLQRLEFDFSEPYWQHDRVFVPHEYARENSLPRLILRTLIIDPSDAPVYQLVMRRHINNRKLDYVNITPIGDYAETAHMLYQLGYELRTEFGRQRQELVMGSSVRIYIDKLDGDNQSYAKIESTLKDNEDPEAAYLDLIETFKVLNITGEPVEKTYAELFDERQAQS